MVKDMTKGSPMKLILGFAIPMLMGMLFQQFYNLVDTMIVGKTLGVDALAGVGATACINFMIIGFCMGVCNGFAIPVAQQFGAGKYSQLRKYVYNGYICSIIFSVVLTVASVVGCRGILTLLRTPSNIYEHAYAYIVVIFAGIPTVFLYNMVSGVIRSLGDSKTPVYFLVVSAVINIILDFVFILVFKMGVAGAAIATAISQLVSTLVYLNYVLRKKSAFTFSVREFAPTKQMMAEILKIGVPTLTFQLLTSLSIALINRAANGYGDAVIAGMGAVTRVTSMGTLVVFGFLKGFQPIAGFSYGAKKFDRLQEAIKTSILWSTIFCVIVGLLMAVFSTQIISQFTDGNAEMISVGQRSLIANGFSFMLFGFYTVYSSLFLALGKGTAGFILGACRQGICFVPVILILPVLWGLNGILYAQPIADVLSAVITVFMASHLHKELSAAKAKMISREQKNF